MELFHCRPNSVLELEAWDATDRQNRKGLQISLVFGAIPYNTGLFQSTRILLPSDQECEKIASFSDSWFPSCTTRPFRSCMEVFRKKYWGLREDRLGGKSEPAPSMKTNISACPQNFSEVPLCMIGIASLYLLVNLWDIATILPCSQGSKVYSFQPLSTGWPVRL